MEQTHGILEGATPDRPREAIDPRAIPYRQLSEASLRLHGVTDLDRLGPITVDVIKAVVGPAASGVLLVRGDEKDLRLPVGPREGEAVPAPAIQVGLDKAIETGHPVVDGQGPSRSVAVPLLAASGRVLGAFQIGAADLERRLGTAWLDLLVLLGRHIGAAFDNARHAKDLRLVQGAGGDEDVPGGLSLRDSKVHFERMLVRARLRESKGNIAAAARSLGMDRGQLSRLIKRHGIDKAQYRALGAGDPH